VSVRHPKNLAWRNKAASYLVAIAMDLEMAAQCFRDSARQYREGEPTSRASEMAEAGFRLALYHALGSFRRWFGKAPGDEA
jgi:hypothetical protein